MKRIALLVLSLFLVLYVQGQPNFKKTRKYLEQARTDWGVPGMAVAIVKDGNVVFSEGFGQLKNGGKQDVDRDTQFAIASNTKAFVASALATLVAEGKISWDDKVTQYLPYFRLYDAYASAETTVRDLLCHRVGLGTFSGDVIWYKSDFTAEEVIKRIQYIPQAYSFRAGYGYSNLMFITAGEVIKAVTGKSWADYVASTFLQPLQMNRTITSVNQIKNNDNVATPHKPVDDKNQPIAWVDWDNMGAAGGIISSVNDMANWMRMNLNNGIWQGDTILSREQQNVLWTPHNNFVLTDLSRTQIPGRHFNGYGLGWGLYDYHGRMVVTHSGGYDGMYSRVAMMPDENLGIVILTNSMSGITFPLTMKLINDFIKEDQRDWSQEFLNRPSEGTDPIKERKAAKISNTKPSLPISAYTGVYDAPMHGDITIKEEDGELRLHFDRAALLSATLKHWHNDTWEILWDETHAWFDFGTVQFELDHNAKVTGMEIDVPNYDIFFHEIETKKRE
ncbi:MAG: serine hydrolase [Cytophagales bacterium]|nr:serine hydrolase [Cytophagales bacterium]